MNETSTVDELDRLRQVRRLEPACVRAARARPRAGRRAAAARAGRSRRRPPPRGGRRAASRQSVKPPVEAPTSRQDMPAGSTARSASAPASFSPPRETKRLGSPRRRTRDSVFTWVPGLSTGASSTSTWPARISASARLRVGASPSSTRRWSSRSPFSSASRRAGPARRGRCPRRRDRRHASARPDRRARSAIGHPETAHRQRGARGGQRLQHRPAEAAHRAVLLDRDEHTAAPGQRHDARRIERLHEARVQHRDREALGRQLGRGLQGRVHQRADRDQHRIVAVAKQLGLPDRQRLQLGIQRHAASLAAREAHGRRPGCSIAVLSMCCSSFSSLGAIRIRLGSVRR